MNKILIITILLILVVWYVNQQHPKTIPKNTSTQSIQTDFLLNSANKQTQTNLNSKQISLLTQQWNQVANWAQEQEIDTNKPWNLSMLKNKLERQLKPTQSTKTSNKETQTEPISPNQDQQALESTLNNLIASMKELNNQI